MVLRRTVLDSHHEDFSLLYTILTLLCILSFARLWVPSREKQNVLHRAATVPYRYPLLRSTIDFAFRGPAFFKQLLKDSWTSTSAIRVRLINKDVYIVHRPKYVGEIFKNPNLSVTKAYGYVLHHCFGMSAKAAAVYHQDTSGSRMKPIPGSHVQQAGRIGLYTHDHLAEGLLGAGLEPVTKRFEVALSKSLQTCDFNEQWTYHDDLAKFFEDILGRAVLEGIFGSLLLETNDQFVQDLFEYDKVVMDLARRIPWFVKPTPYRLRSRIIESIKRWQFAARSSPDSLDAWGSSMMKSRYEKLMQFEGQDEDSVASTNFGLIWASVTNVVPSTLLMATQIYGDPRLLSEVHEALEGRRSNEDALPSTDKLTSIPILASLYAETLRFGVQIHIPRDAPHHTIPVGKVTLPQNSFILMNTWLAHSDAQVWNTQNGIRPLDEFWSERFLVYPNDSSSGPCKKPFVAEEHAQMNAKGAVFSTEGLKGAWIPYGSGHHACPGRLLAKRIMLHTIATLVEQYEIAFLSCDNVPEFASPRFGFGVKKLARKTPFRIRRRDTLRV